MKKILTNKDSGFYEILGPIFGSREVQRETRDRFYDDAGKEWYIEINKNSEALAVVSIADGKIKNVYGKDLECLEKLLKDMYYLTETSTVPGVYLDAYKKAGYTIEESGLKKFVKIKGGVINGGIFL